MVFKGWHFWVNVTSISSSIKYGNQKYLKDWLLLQYGHDGLQYYDYRILSSAISWQTPTNELTNRIPRVSVIEEILNQS